MPPLITHTFPLDPIKEAYGLFEQRDGVLKWRSGPDPGRPSPREPSPPSAPGGFFYQSPLPRRSLRR